VSKPALVRPVLYVAILALAMLGTYAFKLRTQGIFACTAEGYYISKNAYLGYCNATAYGDYDHGAVWFDLEPEVVQGASNADVLFLGSSRMEFGFSSQTTDHLFADLAVKHYLLGFTHTENQAFVAPLLLRLKPRAKVYIVNVDQFFLPVETGPASQILHEPDIERRYREKRIWQQAHRALCTRVAKLCGHDFAYYRSRETGHWKARGTEKHDTSFTSDGPVTDQDKWQNEAMVAQQFIAALPVDRTCVLLTFVPYPGARRAEAEGVAAAAGYELIEPPVEPLQTFDGSHLSPDSAERWSKAFYDVAQPRIRRCLGDSTAAPTPTT
jgi:hypothetical protein